MSARLVLIISSEARTPTPIRNPRIRKQSILASTVHVYVEKSSLYSTAECSYTVKKVSVFPVSQLNSPWPGIMKLFPAMV